MQYSLQQPEDIKRNTWVGSGWRFTHECCRVCGHLGCHLVSSMHEFQSDLLYISKMMSGGLCLGDCGRQWAVIVCGSAEWSLHVCLRMEMLSSKVTSEFWLSPLVCYMRCIYQWFYDFLTQSRKDQTEFISKLHDFFKDFPSAQICMSRCLAKWNTPFLILHLSAYLIDPLCFRHLTARV